MKLKWKENGENKINHQREEKNMAYNMERDTYECDFCGSEIGWDASDDIQGVMWECEKCGRHFCTKCFVDRFGRRDYDQMLQDMDRVHCPDCWRDYKEKSKEAE